MLLAAWSALAALAYATLTKVQFVYEIYFLLSPILGSPDIRHYVRLEHMGAFAVLGILFSLAYPGRPWFVSSAVIFGILILEYFQTLTPDRHGSLADVGEKLLGGMSAIIAFNILRRCRNRGPR